MPDKTVRDFVAAYLRPHRPRLALLAVCFLAGIGLQLANPELAKTFIDQASAGAPFGSTDWSGSTSSASPASTRAAAGA